MREDSITKPRCRRRVQPCNAAALTVRFPACSPSLPANGTKSAIILRPLIHYVPLIYPAQVNLKWWKGLTQAQRDIISKAAVSTEGQAVANIEKEFKDDIAIAKKNGNEVYQPTKEELQQWRDTAGALARKDYLADAGRAMTRRFLMM